jgi:hypothetical protein
LDTLHQWKYECQRINREAGLDEMEYRTHRLSEVEGAFYVLWMEKPATSKEGVVLRLRAWRMRHAVTTEPDLSDTAILTTLADAERLCGVSVTLATAWLKAADYAALTISEFGTP